MGKTKAVSLKAAFELGRRLSIFTEGIRPVIRKPADVYNLLTDEMRSLTIDAGNIIDIEVQDHVIIGDGKYISLRERKYI